MIEDAANVRPLTGAALAPGSSACARMAQIHAMSFRAPWSSDEVAALCAGSAARCFVIGPTASDIEGFALFQAVSPEAELLTVAVDPALRARGVARLLLSHALAHLRTADHVETVHLEVAETNAIALRLYQALGFVEVGRRRGYYATGLVSPPDPSTEVRPPTDAIMMTLELANPR